MKSFLIACSFFVLIACGKGGEHTGHDMHGDADSENPNRALYDQVMDIHDEVMPKMEDIYTLKKTLEEKIANTPGMVEDQKKELEAMIANLDSTSNAMMDWMHHFNPLPDSVDQEKAREYLEMEMETIKKVRDLTNETLEKAKGIAEKK
jgi:Mg2+ and Co2+ transporter CorA